MQIINTSQVNYSNDTALETMQRLLEQQANQHIATVSKMLTIDQQDIQDGEETLVRQAGKLPAPFPLPTKVRAQSESE
jgi:hypothetical protein